MPTGSSRAASSLRTIPSNGERRLGYGGGGGSDDEDGKDDKDKRKIKKDRHDSTDSSSTFEKKKKKNKKKKKSEEDYDAGDGYKWSPRGLFGAPDDGTRPWDNIPHDPDRIPGPSYVPEEHRSWVDYYDNQEDPRIGRFWRLMLKWLSYHDLEAVLDQYAQFMMRRNLRKRKMKRITKENFVKG
eukprot:1228229-Amphidinium_carterae.2